MCEGSSTEGDNICKQEGMVWMREHPEHGTLTKQESKPGDNDCPYIYFQFVVSTLDSKSDELWSDWTIHNNRWNALYE